MPFTATHVAAAVPIAWLCRWRVPFSAIAIGAMVSDIPVFYPNLMDYPTTHTLRGVWTHCTPVGVLGYYVYQGVLKRPLSDLLPQSWTARLWPWINRPLNFSPLSVLMVCLCVAMGATTHVVWDAFTHRGRWGVELFPILNQVAIEQPMRIHWHGLLQHGSSLVMMPVMIIGFLLWVRTLPPDWEALDHAHVPRGLAWAVIALMLVGVVMYFQMIQTHFPAWSLVTQIRTSVKDCGSVILGIVMIYCAGMHLLWWRDRGVAMGNAAEGAA